jgi:hypothetical protein
MNRKKRGEGSGTGWGGQNQRVVTNGWDNVGQEF